MSRKGFSNPLGILNNITYIDNWICCLVGILKVIECIDVNFPRSISHHGSTSRSVRAPLSDFNIIAFSDIRLSTTLLWYVRLFIAKLDRCNSVLIIVVVVFCDGNKELNDINSSLFKFCNSHKK